jgi:hypothetical protein
MLFPGDEIISIGEIYCKEKNIEEINSLLNLERDIISLKIKKCEEHFSDNNFNDGKMRNILSFVKINFHLIKFKKLLSTR